MVTNSLQKGVAILGLTAAAAAYVGRGHWPDVAKPAPVVLAIAAVQPQGAVRAEGRLVAYPGAEVTVGNDRGGTIAKVLLREGALVQKGQLLAQLDSEEDRAALAEAKARVLEADAQVRFSDSEAERVRQLWKDKIAARQEMDRTLQEKEVARARRDVASAAVRRLEAALQKSRIVSPIDGMVIARFVHSGETVDRGADFMTIADLRQTRIEAEVDEFDAGRVVLGSEVTVTVEGYEGKAWRGTVEEIPDAVVGRSIKPNDPGRPTDTRVLRVKIRLQEATPLKLGQRVEIEIHPARH